MMEGTEGLTEIEGGLTLLPLFGARDSFTAMVGMLGVTEMDGVSLFLYPLDGIGDSLTAIVGMAGVLFLEPLPGAGDSLTEIDGMGGEPEVEEWLLL